MRTRLEPGYETSSESEVRKSARRLGTLSVSGACVLVGYWKELTLSGMWHPHVTQDLSPKRGLVSIEGLCNVSPLSPAASQTHSQLMFAARSTDSLGACRSLPPEIVSLCKLIDFFSVLWQLGSLKVWAVRLVLGFKSRKMHCLTRDRSYIFWLAKILNIPVVMESISDFRSYCSLSLRILEVTDRWQSKTNLYRQAGVKTGES